MRGSARDCAKHEEEVTGKLPPPTDTITAGAETPATTGKSANRVTQHRSREPPRTSASASAPDTQRHARRCVPVRPRRPEPYPSHRAKSPCVASDTGLFAGTSRCGGRDLRAPLPQSTLTPRVLFGKVAEIGYLQALSPVWPPDLSEKYGDLSAKIHARSEHGSWQSAPADNASRTAWSAAQRLHVELRRVPSAGLGLVVVRSHPAHSCPPAPRRLLSRRDPSTGTVGLCASLSPSSRAERR